MSNDLANRRVGRQMTIHTVLQVLLGILLVFMAFRFQLVFRAKGMPQIFLNSVIVTVVIQLLAFYPIYRFAVAEARRDIAAARATDTAELHKYRQHRIYFDFIKATVFIFYAIFIWLAPPVTFALSTAFFSFMATALTYLQCYNYAAKRLLRGEIE